MMAQTVVVGLGANLGERAETLHAAVALLAGVEGIRVVRMSSLYRTDPVGPPQPDYLNAAVRIETTLDLHALLSETQRIESALGRIRGPVRWGPRTADLDLLWSDGASVCDDRLEVPHPRLRERVFALAPLLEVAPELAPELGPALDALGGVPERWDEARENPP